jgi:hypothetical protein
LTRTDLDRTRIGARVSFMGIACACGLVIGGGALATTPTPPARPAEFSKSPAAPNAGAPAGATGGRQPVDVDVRSLQPYNLPPASRAKMRACGEEWRALKLAGQATGLTWRGFAEKCLVK